FRQLRIGHSHKLLFDFPLAGGVAEPSNGRALRLDLILIFVCIFICIFSSLIKRLQVRANQHEEQKNSRENFHEAPCKKCRRLIQILSSTVRTSSTDATRSWAYVLRNMTLPPRSTMNTARSLAPAPAPDFRKTP